MSSNRQIALQDCSDQELVDLFERRRERAALGELYERYRVSIGNYLSRDIKNKEAVADTFNSMILELVTNTASQPGAGTVSTKLFAMAHEYRRAYAVKGTAKVAERDNAAKAAVAYPAENNKFKNKLASLPRLHRDVLELAYSYNFTFDEVAEIVGCKASVVSDCLLHIKNEYLTLVRATNQPQDALLNDHLCGSVR